MQGEMKSIDVVEVTLQAPFICQLCAAIDVVCDAARSEFTSISSLRASLTSPLSLVRIIVRRIRIPC